LRAWLLLLPLALCAEAALAHAPSDAYLVLRAAPGSARVELRLDVALRDLEQEPGLDADADGRITWGELRAARAALEAYAFAHLSLASDGAPCPLRPAGLEAALHSDGAYAVLLAEASCARPPAALEVDYRLFRALDPQHRGLVRVEHPGGTATAVLGGERSRERIALGAPDLRRAGLAYLAEGVRHIALGFDHLLFLLSLLLPAVLRRAGARWEPEPALRPALADVLSVVSAFTLAHSLTLSLAALGVLRLPSRGVESAIAASVVLAAANNLRPLVGRRRWLAAFAFGLVHGLGFASVLADLGLPRGALVVSLLAFNLGVELGQLAFVALLLPVAWWLRAWPAYPSVVLAGGSAAIALLASLWLAERSLGLALLGG
jgi:hypothetical protein